MCFYILHGFALCLYLSLYFSLKQYVTLVLLNKRYGKFYILESLVGQKLIWVLWPKLKFRLKYIFISRMMLNLSFNYSRAYGNRRMESDEFSSSAMRNTLSEAVSAGRMILSNSLSCSCHTSRIVPLERQCSPN